MTRRIRDLILSIAALAIVTAVAVAFLVHLCREFEAEDAAHETARHGDRP